LSSKRFKSAVVAVVLLLASAGSATATGPSADELAQVLGRRTLILATDPAYPPQSYRVQGAKRLGNTRCAANQLTGNQMAGYDADVSKLVAEALGVEACFVVPTWSEMISGHWGDRWDIAFVSMGITYDRMQRLYSTRPYSAEAGGSSFARTLRSPRCRSSRASGSAAVAVALRSTTFREPCACRGRA
jgi:ABC-type amino acid transport substrate-binding protein